MATTAATLVVKVVADTANAVKGVKGVSDSTSSWKNKLGAASKVATAGLFAMGGAAIYAGKAAAEDAKGQAVLANSMKNSAGATDAQVKSTEDFIAKTALATGVADDELRPAMGNLVRATGDVALSQKDLGIALDIAAATGKDVTTVTAAMAKGYGGNEAALNKLLPSVAKTADKTKDFDKVMQAAAKTTKGAAAASADTAAGKTQRMAVAMDEATEAIGAGLLPVIGPLATLLGKLAVFIGNNAKAFQIIAVVVATVAAAIVILNAAVNAFTLATTIAGIAAEHAWVAALGPIALVVAAIVAIVVVLVVLYKKVKWFRDFVNAAWAIIKRATSAAAKVIASAFRAALSTVGALVKRYGGIFKSVWQAVIAAVKGYVQVWVAYFKLVFGVIKGLVKLVVAIFKGDWRGALDAVRGIVRSFIDFFRSIFNLLPDPVRRVASAIKDALGRAFEWLRGKVSALGDVLSRPFNTMHDAVDKVVGIVQDLIGWLGKIHVPDLSKIGGLVGKIPGLGRSAPTTPTTNVAARFGAPMVRGATARVGASSGGPTIIVQGAIDPEATARQIQRILAGHDRRMGLRSA